MEKSTSLPASNFSSAHTFVPADASSFIQGDLYDGFVISDFKDTEYQFDFHSPSGKKVHGQILQKIIRSQEDRLCLGLFFLLEEPVRLRIEVLVPENCKNARVSLQDQELLPFFSDYIPPNLETISTTNCHDQKQKYSPLKPGHFQSINFRWQSGDVLKYFFYF